jgi:hypothetical protein
LEEDLTASSIASDVTDFKCCAEMRANAAILDVGSERLITVEFKRE